jgi:hypothetical protein
MYLKATLLVEILTSVTDVVIRRPTLGVGLIFTTEFHEFPEELRRKHMVPPGPLHDYANRCEQRGNLLLTMLTPSSTLFLK